MAKRTNKQTDSAYPLEPTLVEPTFVEFIPERLEPGRLYVSMEYGAVAHLCACGCGAKVDTPLTPTDWQLEYDGEAVTLSPSVGSWSLPCRSHYFIVANRIRWADPWSDERIRLGRVSDKLAKQKYYDTGSTTSSSMSVDSPPESVWGNGVWRWLRRWLCGWWPW